MKKFLIISLVTITSLNSCSNLQQIIKGQNDKPQDSVDTNSVADADNDSPENTEEKQTTSDTTEFLHKYREEGFVNSNTFTVIIVRPSDSATNDLEIKKQAIRRTIVFLKKYKQEKGQRITPKTNTAILNLVKERGILKKVEDKEHSRLVYYFILEVDGLQRQIDNM